MLLMLVVYEQKEETSISSFDACMLLLLSSKKHTRLTSIYIMPQKKVFMTNIQKKRVTLIISDKYHSNHPNTKPS